MTLIRSHSKVKSVVSEAMKNPSLISLAKKVESNDFMQKLEDKRLPGNVFFDLMGRKRSFNRIDGVGEYHTIMNVDNFLANPMFKTCVKYLNAFNTKYPDEKTNMIKSLLLYYTDDTLSQALIAAKQVPSTEKMATNLQLSLLNKWAREKKPPVEVSKLLNVGSSDMLMKTYTNKYNWALKNVADNKVFEHLTVQTWNKYVGDFVAMKGDASSMIAKLTDRYGAKSVAQMIEISKNNGVATNTRAAAPKLEAAQFKAWVDSKMSVDDVLHLLKLDEKVNMQLDNPLMKGTLRAYTNQLNRKNRNAPTTFIQVLMRNYSNEALSKMLITAKDSWSAKTLATSLQGKLLERWLEAGIHPKVVFKWLQLERSALNSAERPVYQKYALNYKKKYFAGRVS